VQLFLIIVKHKSENGQFYLVFGRNWRLAGKQMSANEPFF